MLTFRWTKPVNHYYIHRSLLKRLCYAYTMEQETAMCWWREHHLILLGCMWFVWTGPKNAKF